MSFLHIDIQGLFIVRLKSKIYPSFLLGLLQKYLLLYYCHWKRYNEHLHRLLGGCCLSWHLLLFYSLNDAGYFEEVLHNDKSHEHEGGFHARYKVCSGNCTGSVHEELLQGLRFPWSLIAFLHSAPGNPILDSIH